MTIHFLSLSQLPACSLGCYGEHRIPTPHFDVLASRSWVCNGYFSLSGRQVFQSDEIRQYHWDAPALELSFLFQAAECWLTDDQQALIFSPQEEMDTSLKGALERLRRMISPFQCQLIESTATTLAYDAAIGEFVDGLDLDEEDVLVVIGTSGDRRRLPVERTEGVAAVSDVMVNLPLLIYSPGLTEAGRIEELIGPDDVARLVTSYAGQPVEPLTAWRESLIAERILLRSPLVSAIRTRSWLLVDQRASKHYDNPVVDYIAADIALFHKPEDQWEMLDVASQFPELIENYVSTGTLDCTAAPDTATSSD